MNEPHEVRRRLAVLLVLVALASVPLVSFLYAPRFVPASAPSSEPSAPHAADGVTVVFGSVGDFDNKAPSYPDMVALAKRLGSRGGMFLLAVGDLGYTADEQTWCGAIKGAFNNTLVVAGNHDTTESGPGDINNDVIYCPFNVDSTLVSGPTYGYGKSYYFDYPSSAPLVRVLMISAGTTGTQVSGQNYAPGGPEYNWVVNAVNGARTAGIPWVVVGSHKMCITVGSKTSCEFGQALFNKLVDLKVDLFVQGHDHVYERSKQLAISANCPSVLSGGQFDPDCVVASGPDFTKGNGPIVVVDGAGGRDLYTVHIDGSDKELGYFDAVMGTNANTEGKTNGHGTILVRLNATTLTGTTTFCPLGSGDAATGECPSKVPTTFLDSFTISSVATPPPPLTANFGYSPSNPVAGETVTFTAAVSGGTPPYAYAWEFGDGATGSGVTVAHAYANPGSYAANLTSTDSDSHGDSASKTVVVTVPPSLSADFSFNPSNPAVGQTVTFTGTATGGASPYTYAWEFGDSATGSGATASHVYASPGSFIANLSVSDSDSITAHASKTVSVAVPPPLAADFSFSPTGPETGQTVTFTASASGGTPPYVYAWQFGDGATGSGGSATHVYGTAGTYIVNLVVNDAALMTARVSKSTVVFAPPPPGSPTAVFTFSPTWPRTNAAVAFDASVSSDPNPGAILQFRWDWTNDGTFDTGWLTSAGTSHTYDTAGNYIARLEVQDDAGRADNMTTSVPVDGAAPTTDSSLSGTLGQHGWYRSSVSIRLAATDDISGVAGTWTRRDNASWSQGTSVTFTNDRVHTLDYYSTDRSGHVEATHTLVLPIDQVPPSTSAVVQGTQDANGSYVASANVTFSATDVLSGVASTSFRIDGGAWSTYSMPVQVIGGGVHALEFFTTDVAGNSESIQTLSIRIADSSSMPPAGLPVTRLSLSGTRGSAGWYVSPVVVTLTGLSPIGLTLTIHYRLDGGSWHTYSAPFQVADGVHNLDYNATDAASQQEAMHTASVSVDSTPPITAVFLAGTPGRDHWYVSAVTVTLSATDTGSGVASTSYRIDGSSWQAYTDPFIVGSGRHQLEYGSADVAGGQAVPTVTSIKIDLSVPRIRLSPVPATVTVPQVHIAWNVTDDVAGVVENGIWVDAGSSESVGLNVTVTLPLPDGVHAIRVWAMDEAGNRAIAEINVRVDTNPFSPAGPYGGVPLYLILELAGGLTIVLLWRHRSHKKRQERQAALRRMRARSR